MEKLEAAGVASVDLRRGEAHALPIEDNEVDAAFARFRDTGATILKEPELVFWGGYSGYIAGPSGEQWEIAYNPFTSVNADGTYG